MGHSRERRRITEAATEVSEVRLSRLALGTRSPKAKHEKPAKANCAAVKAGDIPKGASAKAPDSPRNQQDTSARTKNVRRQKSVRRIARHDGRGTARFSGRIETLAR